MSGEVLGRTTGVGVGAQKRGLSMKLKDKVAIVTGGSQGIGEAVSEAYAREGAKVVVVNHGRPELGQRVAEKIAAGGGTAAAMRCDVSKKSDVESLVESVVKEFGTVDILVSNAGRMINKVIEDYTEEEWDTMIDINLKGAFLTAQAVVPVMKEKRSGKIIFVASIAGSVAFPNSVPYCASKGGVLLITKALAAEISKFGINVNAISPGNTATPLNQHLQDNPGFVKMLESFTPTNRAYISTEEIAGAAVFLASSDARAVHGLDLIVDDGWCAI
jgi:glucose 1-dehydrogenase